MKPKGVAILILLAVVLFFGYTKFIKKDNTEPTKSEVSVSAKDTTLYGYKPLTDTVEVLDEVHVLPVEQVKKPTVRKVRKEKAVHAQSTKVVEEESQNQNVNNVIPKF